MIPAAPAHWFSWLFARHARQRLFRTFGDIRMAGLEGLRAALAEGPVLVIANHTTWWDPLVALWLAHVELGAEAYAMMDASNLRRLPFFEKVGAFGVDLADRRDGARAIRYAAGLLDRPGRLVWIYPQGRECSPFEPLELRPGAAAVARVARCGVVPIGTRFVFGAREKPELWISVGPKVNAPPDLTTLIAEQLARIDRRRANPEAEDGFDVVHRTLPGWLDRTAEQALGVIARLF